MSTLNGTLNGTALSPNDARAPRPGVKARNCARIRAYFATHLCASTIECSNALGLSRTCVSFHVQTIRAEWEGKEASPPAPNHDVTTITE